MYFHYLVCTRGSFLHYFDPRSNDISNMMKIVLSLALVLSGASLGAQKKIRSQLQTYDLATGEIQTILTEDAHFEAPNWSKDGTFFIINQNGRIFKVDAQGNKEIVDTGIATRCNNDHVISPDGQTLAVSSNVEEGPEGWLTSCIFTVPITGGEAVRVTPKVPSFLHGWSPDGKRLAYTGSRNGQFDIYTISLDGGEEVQLTHTQGLSDGPEYSNDGKYIYYNAMDTGKMELWRMDADGKNNVRLTRDAFSNWFPHVAPNDRELVYIAYLVDQGSSHPPMKRVMLRHYDLATGNITTLHTFTGGQGSINVPSWSPDGSKFAFVSYEYLDTQD